jgi:AraC-like DNA-binding protein
MTIANYHFFSSQNRIVLACMLIVPLLLAVPLVIDMHSLKRNIFPSNEFGNRIHAYTDKGWKGNSTIDNFQADSSTITLVYALHEGARYPMVFLLISLDVSGKACDLSRYDRVSIRIREATNKQILMYIKTFLQGVSLYEDKYAGTLRHNEYTLSLSPGKHEYETGLNEFVTSKWWLDANKFNPYIIPVEKYDNVKSFDIQFNTAGSDYKIGRQEKISIEKIYFERPLSLLSIIPAVVMCLYYPCFAVFAFRARSRKARIPDQQPLGIANFRDKQLQRIKALLEAHYSDPDITTRMIYAETGIPPERVFRLLKESYHLTFKQIINAMRIKEAKRLLRESDLRVTEIAMKLGFGQHSYFNHLFKEQEGMTPSEFRDTAT